MVNSCSQPDSIDTPFRYALVEDEPLARKALSRMLAHLAPDGVLVWEAEDGHQALRRLMEEPVDVLFLDIMFPPEGAFGLLESAWSQLSVLPEIVFVTSLENEAARAFEWAACDYLVKPVTQDRVRATLERVRRRRSPADRKALFSAMRGVLRSTGPERFTVAVKDRILVFRWSEVFYFHTEFRQVFAETSRGKVPIDLPMDELESMLSHMFLRIHRSTLVNLNYLTEVHTSAGCAGKVLMCNGASLPVSRRRKEALLAKLAGMDRPGQKGKSDGAILVQDGPPRWGAPLS